MKIHQLHLAARKLDLARVNELLEEGADPNKKDRDGQTPILVALNAVRPKYTPSNAQEAIQIVDALLAHGANINAMNARVGTPLHYATFWGQDEIVEHLVAKGANMY